MKKFFITTLFNAFFLAVMTAGNTPTLSIYSPVTEPLHEVRAVWLTTIGGIDWPLLCPALPAPFGGGAATRAVPDT